jgi:hypothetical protein
MRWTNLIKFHSVLYGEHLPTQNCTGSVFRKVTVGALGAQMVTQRAHVLACIFRDQHVYRITVDIASKVNPSAGQIAAGPQQHSQSWVRVPQIFVLSETFYVFCNGASSSTNGSVWLLLVTPPLLGEKTALSVGRLDFTSSGLPRKNRLSFQHIQDQSYMRKYLQHVHNSS